MVMFQFLLLDIEPDDTGGDKSEVVIARDQRKIFVAPK